MADINTSTPKILNIMNLRFNNYSIKKMGTPNNMAVMMDNRADLMSG